MKLVWLFRTEESDQGTFGHLVCEGFHLHTGELPWRENTQRISCIPAEHYRVEWEPTGRFKGYAIRAVLNRTSIEIHKGNWCGDVSKGFKSNVLGCICLGLGRGRMTPPGSPVKSQQEAIISSSKAIEKFHSFMKKEPFLLIIEDKFKEEEDS